MEVTKEKQLSRVILKLKIQNFIDKKAKRLRTSRTRTKANVR